MNYLLDTNALVDHIRFGSASSVTARMAVVPPQSVLLCTVVLGELIYGAVRGGPAHEHANRAAVAALTRRFRVVPFDAAAAEEYGKLRAYLTTAGKLIGANDLLIAAIALANGVTLVTHNTAEFGRVPNLLLEDWQ